MLSLLFSLFYFLLFAEGVDVPVGCKSQDCAVPINNLGSAEAAEEPPKMCSEALAAAENACSKAGIAATISPALMAAIQGVSAMKEDKDSSEAVKDHGQITQTVGGANAAVGGYCLIKAKRCITTCTDVAAVCDPSGCSRFPPTAGLPVCQTENGFFSPSECKVAKGAIAACTTLKDTAYASLAQAGILGLVGEMMKNASRGMKDDVEVAPPAPPTPSGVGGGTSPMSLGVGSLSGSSGPGQLANSKTTPGKASSPVAPPEAGLTAPDEADEEKKDDLASNSAPSSPSGGSPGGGLPAGSGAGLGENPFEDGEKGRDDFRYDGYSGTGGEGFLSGGGLRRGSARGSGSYGRRSYYGGGGGRGGAGKRKAASTSKKPGRAKRDIFQKGSRHRSIFEIMSERIQSFCREGARVCE